MSFTSLEEGAEAMFETLNELQSYAEIERGTFAAIKMTSFELKTIVHKVDRVFATAMSAHRINFSIDIDQIEGVWVNGDEARIRQVLSNFLSNAIKFTPELGTIKLAVVLRHMHMNKQGLKFMDVEFSVKNSGAGIKPSDMQILFKPFVQLEDRERAQGRGSGLGLSICSHIVDKMGG
jgi:signal transduction histidine kinase